MRVPSTATRPGFGLDRSVVDVAAELLDQRLGQAVGIHRRDVGRLGAGAVLLEAVPDVEVLLEVAERLDAAPPERPGHQGIALGRMPS